MMQVGQTVDGRIEHVDFTSGGLGGKFIIRVRPNSGLPVEIYIRVPEDAYELRCALIAVGAAPVDMDAGKEMTVTEDMFVGRQVRVGRNDNGFVILPVVIQ